MNQMARMKGLYAVLNHVSENLHKISNRLGDSVSRKVSLSVLDTVSEDYDKPVLDAKNDVEALYLGGLTARGRRALATRRNIKGGSLFGDNVGKV